ncbi:hypothetical protein [Xanthocytophaga agilis]|uniref:Uncharacterized protein n=1 Tax=Xanthocytophaga agilis TaxID=3048010 RepID=A0AAE3R9L2_9BACT|nr:hypothetical protein [Xanthocytophaga agilis]MDJ1506166.1 hypothetical protein [Xanthocytophaga agilis]
MKRLVSICLLFLLLYHSIGYFLLFEWKKTEARTALHESVQDQSIQGNTLPQKDWLIFKVPIGWYHQTNRGFEKVNGELTHRGKIYEKVIQRIVNDTLFVYCVNNIKQEKVLDDLQTHLKTHVLDLSKKDTKQSSSPIKSFFKQVYLPYLPVCFRLISEAGDNQNTCFFWDCSYTSGIPTILTPPPEFSLS